MDKLKGPNEPSGPEIQMIEILDGMGLIYEYEFPVKSGFILDFAWPERRIGIEIDGYWHQFTRSRDAFRDHILKRGGWTILRIEANDLDKIEEIKGRIRMLLA